MKKKELQEKRALLIKQETDLLDRLNAEPRLPNEDETATLDRLKAEIEAVEGQLSEIDKLEQRTRENAERLAKSGARREPAQARENILDKPWESLGEQLVAVALAAVTPSKTDPRLLATLAPTGASEQVPSDGGFLVQSDFSAELIKKAHDASEVAKRCREIPISSNSNRVKLNSVDETSRANGSRWGGVRVYRDTEAGTVTPTKPKFAPIGIELEKLTGLFYATEELMEDASALGAIAAEAFVEEMAFVLDDEIINGDGSAKCLGILNSGCLVTITEESSQASDTLLWANVRKMRARMYPRGHANAVWFVNSDVLPALETMKFDDAATSPVPVFMPANGVTGTPFGTLYGRPIVVIEQAATLGDVGDIIYADMSQYLLATKGGIKAAQSLHVRFIYGEQTFRWTRRVNGQPAWRTALTPFKGTNSLSPFVVVETR